MSETRPDAPRALVFDVQGTLLDFYTPVSEAVGQALSERGLDRDVDAFVNAWRKSYFDGMSPVADGKRDWIPTHRIYREGLDAILQRDGLADRFTDDEREALTAVWTELVPWRDTVEGLRRLRRRHILVALSNGGLGSTIAMSARHDLAFHAVLTGELVRNFKPHPSLYRLAIESLALPAGQVMMVAAHPYDLEAAASHGMQAAFIDRPHEFGPHRRNEAERPACAAIGVDGVTALADRLGCD